MKPIFLTCFLLCIMHYLAGQVSGKLVNTSGQSVSFANISLLKSPDSVFVKGTISNENGEYKIDNIAPGNYFLRFSSAGYHSWESPVFDLSTLQKDSSLNVIVMYENRNAMEEVVVRGQKPLVEQQPSGTIIHVENSLLTKGSSALEVLARSPGVVINYRDNSIELNGKAGIMVMLDGKLMRMPVEQVVNLLSGMSADEIASIQLLTTPPAGYDAEGTGGLINIVLKKNRKEGTTGSASVTAGYGFREKGTGNLSITHNTGKIRVNGSYAFSHNSTYSDMTVVSAQDMPFMGGDVSVLGYFNTRALRNDHDASLGLEFNLNPSITIGGNLNYNSSKFSSINNTNAGYTVLPDSLLQFNGINRNLNRWNNLVNSIYLQKSFSENEKLNIDLDYLYFNNDGGADVQSSFINKHGTQAGTDEMLFSPRQKGFANTKIKVVVGKLDYTKQFNKKIKLEAGLKAAYTQSSSLSGIESLLNGEWTGSDQTSNNISMKESISALYASATSQISKSVNLVAGVRYEYASTIMDNIQTGKNVVDRKLGSFFPSILLDKKINDESGFQFSYSRRISRPSYNDLASYVGYSDPTAVYTGNSFLKPNISNILKFGYNYRDYSLSLMFSRDINAISRYQLTESPDRNILFISPQNLAWLNNITLQVNIPWKVGNWWTMNYGFVGGLRQYKVDFTKYAFEKSYFGYTASFSQSFILPRNFSAEISGLYNGASYDGTKKIDGFGVLNAGIKLKLKKDWGSIQLAVADILRSERYNIRYGTLTEEAFFIRSHVTFYPESGKYSIFKLTYSRSFGDNKTKSLRSNSNEEQDRVRKE